MYVRCTVFVPSHSVHFTDDDMLQESGIYSGQLMILEVKKADGRWPCIINVQTQLNEIRSLLGIRLEENCYW